MPADTAIRVGESLHRGGEGCEAEHGLCVPRHEHCDARQCTPASANTEAEHTLGNTQRPPGTESVFSSCVLNLLSSEALEGLRLSTSWPPSGETTAGIAHLAKAQGKGAGRRRSGRHVAQPRKHGRKHNRSSGSEAFSGTKHTPKSPKTCSPLEARCRQQECDGQILEGGLSNHIPPELHTGADSVEVSADSSMSCSSGLAVGISPSNQPCRRRLTVALDLDDTLVVSFRKESAPWSIRCGTGAAKHLARHEIPFGPGKDIEAPISGTMILVERPGLHEFLARLKAFANVVLFTAGLRSYAEPIVSRIDPNGELFDRVLYRDSTVSMGGQENVKDLSVVLNHPSDGFGRIALLDNSPFSFVAQPENGIPVVPFSGDPMDRELLDHQLPLLKTLDEMDDIRELVSSRFHVRDWLVRHGCQPPPEMNGPSTRRETT